MYALKRIGKINRDDLKQLKENEKPGLEFNPGLSANRPLNNWALFPKTWFPQVRKCPGNKKNSSRLSKSQGIFIRVWGKKSVKKVKEK